MRAIIFAAGHAVEESAIGYRYPYPLLPLGGRPFLFYCIESLVRFGIKQFDIVLCISPDRIEAKASCGERWGSAITYHLVREPETPYHVLKRLTFAENERFIIAHADRLPALHLAELLNTGGPDQTILFMENARSSEESNPEKWTGWGILPAELIPRFQNDFKESDLYHFLVSGEPQGTKREVAGCLSIQTYGDFLTSNKRVLDKSFPDLLIGGNEIEDGIWLSRNVVLHPTVKLTPPVFIAENCRIEAGSQLGPHAVICHDCILDKKCKVENSVIFSGSYIGQDVEVRDSIVDKNCLINTEIGASIAITDEFVLGSLKENRFIHLFNHVFSQCTGIVLLVLFSPLTGLTALWRYLMKKSPVLIRTEAVRLPVLIEDIQWKTFTQYSFSRKPPRRGLEHFFLWFLPGLINIAKGEMKFAGVPPRSQKEVALLANDWRNLYCQSKPGLITETWIYHGADVNEDEKYASETVYIISAGLRHDFYLLLKYGKKLFQR